MTDDEDDNDNDDVDLGEKAIEERLRDYHDRDVVDISEHMPTLGEFIAGHQKSAKESVLRLLLKVSTAVEAMADDEVAQVVDQIAASIVPQAPCPRCALDDLLDRFIHTLSNPVGESGDAEAT